MAAQVMPSLTAPCTADGAVSLRAPAWAGREPRGGSPTLHPELWERRPPPFFPEATQMKLRGINGSQHLYQQDIWGT